MDDVGWVDTTSRGHRVIGYRGTLLGVFRVGEGLRANWMVGHHNAMITVGLPFEWPTWNQGRVACGLVSFRYGDSPPSTKEDDDGI